MTLQLRRRLLRERSNGRRSDSTMSIYKTFAQNLREECTRFDSIAEVCRRSGINRQQFNKYLSGSTIPNARTLYKLSSFLKIEEAQLFLRPTDKKALQLATSNKGIAVPNNLSLTKMLQSLGSDCRVDERFAVSSDFGEGYYKCYFPLEGFPNFLVRSILKTKVIGSEMRFVRHTRMKSPSNRGQIAALGKHHGYVLNDATSIILLGKNLCSPFNFSAIYLRKGPMYGLKVKPGLGFVQGTASPFACRVCVEDLAPAKSALREAICSAGIVALNDPSVSRDVAVSMTCENEAPFGVLKSTPLDFLLGLKIQNN